MPDDEDSEWDVETTDVSGDASAEPSDGEQPPDEEGEWRFALSDLPDEDADEDDSEEQSAVGGNVFGSLSSDTEVIEAGSPTREGTLFVVVGAVLALLFFLQFYLLMG